MDPRVHQLYHQPVYFPARTSNKQDVNPPDKFKEILTNQTGLKVSRHAEERLLQREIKLTNNQWDVISQKVGEARKKGITDSLVITNKAALLVSVKNNTVVTAMNRQEASNKIFTNINGTILIEE